MTDVVPISSKQYRTVWISDTHLGFHGCQARKLRNFIEHTQCQTLYLVGDIIDFWAMRKKLYWPKSHNEVLHAIFRKAQTGTSVIYIPGNHDELMRRYVGSCFANIKIERNAVHVTASGKKYKILHGDEFDSVVRHSKFLANLGSKAYDFLLRMNTIINFFRRRFGLGYWSLSAFLKKKVKKAVNYIGSYEKVVAEDARKNSVDGIICGHIHKAEISDMNEVEYFNCGDWVESCTALVEHVDGRMDLLDLRQLATEPAVFRPQAA